MAVRSFGSSLIRRTRNTGKRRPNRALDKAAHAVAALRGDRVTPMPPDHAPSSIDNVSAAASDYGISRFSGESEAMGSAAGGYRTTNKRRRARR